MPDIPIPAPANWRRPAPTPVTVEIVTEPPHPLCVATIVVGHDGRLNVPLYSLHVGGEETIYVTAAQLAALLLAACQLVKAADLQETVQ